MEILLREKNSIILGHGKGSTGENAERKIMAKDDRNMK